MSTPTDAECAQYRTRYEEADRALHELMIGEASVRVRFNGKESEYTRASVGDLRRYVEYLHSKVRQCDGCRSSGRILSVIPTN